MGRTGAEIKAHILYKYPYLNDNYGWKIQDEAKYFAAGLTWGKRNERFNVQAMPEGYIFTDEGQGILPHNSDDSYLLLGILNSALVAYYLSLTSGLQKHYVYVRQVPIPRCEGAARAQLEAAVRKCLYVKTAWATMSEVDPLHAGPLRRGHSLKDRTLGQLTTEMVGSWYTDKQELASQRRLIDELIFRCAGIGASDVREALEYRSQFPDDVPDDGTFVPEHSEAARQIAVSLSASRSDTLFAGGTRASWHSQSLRNPTSLPVYLSEEADAATPWRAGHARQHRPLAQ